LGFSVRGCRRAQQEDEWSGAAVHDGDFRAVQLDPGIVNPQPKKAAMRCSTVETLKPFKPRVVESLVSTTFSKEALIEGWKKHPSNESNTVSAGAGLIVRLTGCPNGALFRYN